MLKLVNKYSNVRNVFLTRLCAVGLSSSSAESTPSTPTAKEANINEMNTQSRQHPSRPANLKDAKLTNVIESKEEFEKYVKRILPSFLIPDPPKHESYPTPSGWVPPDYQRCTKLPYYVLRTRFHQYPIYPEERDGSKRYVRIKNIEGDIWVCFFFHLFLIPTSTSITLVLSLM